MDIEVNSKCACIIAIGMSGTGKTTFVQVFKYAFRNFMKLLIPKKL